jgi:hypothetical protein
MMSGTVRLYAATVESLQVQIVTPTSPTATAPEFALSTPTAVAPGSFTAGTWSGAWDAATGRTLAVTPTLCATGALEVASGSSYQLWAKVTIGAETAVWPVGGITVP